MSSLKAKKISSFYNFTLGSCFLMSPVYLRVLYISYLEESWKLLLFLWGAFLEVRIVNLD